MNVKKSFVIHENGEPTHYLGLKAYMEENNIELVYVEFSILKKIIKSILGRDNSLLFKQLKNIYWLLKLTFSKDHVIIAGIAPMDWRLIYLRLIFNNHKIFYHTSWPYWHGKFYPKMQYSDYRIIMRVWIKFLEEEVCGIFTVTRSAKKSLEDNFSLNIPIYVVYHSIYRQKKIKTSYNSKKTFDLLFVGRLVPEKGVKEIMELMDVLTTNNFRLKIVGSGELETEIVNWSRNKNNVEYFGHINDKEVLSEIYSNSDVLLLPSKKTYNWEELFGMVLIEAMSVGVIPIATNHVGPNEVITDGYNGFLINDNDEIVENLKQQVLKLKRNNLSILKENVYDYSQKFTINNIKLNWAASKISELVE